MQDAGHDHRGKFQGYGEYISVEKTEIEIVGNEANNNNNNIIHSPPHSTKLSANPSLPHANA